MRYWLMKTEPSVFGLHDLQACPDQTTPWEGVRNHQARNFMRDAMQVGDGVLFYHSNCKEPGIVAVCTIARAGYPDDSALDPASPYHDPASRPERPIWYRVDVRLLRPLPRVLTLAELRQHAERWPDFLLLRRGNRLSVLPVAEPVWQALLALAETDPV